MSDLRLPGLTPEDPENLLSTEARQRVSIALSEFDRIKKQALAAIESRYLAESPGHVSFWEYMGTGSAYIELIESRVQAARTVLRVEAEEYRKLGLRHPEFRQIMEEKIDAMVYSMEFSTLQRDALEAEVLRPAEAGRAMSPSGDDIVRSAADRVKAFIKEHKLKRTGFAKAARISPRNLAYVLSGKKVSYETQTSIAAALGITAQELFPD